MLVTWTWTHLRFIHKRYLETSQGAWMPRRSATLFFRCVIIVVGIEEWSCPTFTDIFLFGSTKRRYAME